MVSWQRSGGGTLSGGYCGSIFEKEGEGVSISITDIWEGGVIVMPGRCVVCGAYLTGHQDYCLRCFNSKLEELEEKYGIHEKGPSAPGEET